MAKRHAFLSLLLMLAVGGSTLAASPSRGAVHQPVSDRSVVTSHAPSFEGPISSVQMLIVGHRVVFTFHDGVGLVFFEVPTFDGPQTYGISDGPDVGDPLGVKGSSIPVTSSSTRH